LKHPGDTVDAAMQRAGHPGDRLDPTVRLLDPLTDRCCATIKVRIPDNQDEKVVAELVS
jgi:hypothetical protein